MAEAQEPKELWRVVPDNSDKTRTAITVFTDDLKVFTALARLKYEKDPVNTAWREAMNLFIDKNMELFRNTFNLLEHRDTSASVEGEIDAAFQQQFTSGRKARRK